MQDIKNNPRVYTTQEGIGDIKYNPQVYTTQEVIGETKYNPQVYLTQEGIGEIYTRYTPPKRVCKRFKKPSGIHYPKGYRND